MLSLVDRYLTDCKMNDLEWLFHVKIRFRPALCCRIDASFGAHCTTGGVSGQRGRSRMYLYLTVFFVKLSCLQQNSKKRMTYVPAVFMIWLAIPAFMITMACLSTDIINGLCTPWGANGGYYEKAVSLSVIFVSYLLPLGLMIFCYSRIIYTLRIKVK